ncbi:MAG: hypothetical protein JSV03_00915 [Planctomycetota bacterium]|nr:MAG: hypothetical protein JSV03_00915 [Planctomycetota bacterium]
MVLDDFDPNSRPIIMNPTPSGIHLGETTPPNHPHEIQIDLAKVTKINSFLYLPRQDMLTDGSPITKFMSAMMAKIWVNQQLRIHLIKKQPEKMVTFS